MNYSDIVKYLSDLLGDKFYVEESKKVIFVKPENWSQVSAFLKNDDKLTFDYMMCLTSYDKGDKKTYGVAYNLYSTVYRHYIEIRVEVDDESAIPSVALLWRTADWHEREAYDMMGIKFDGHPNFKRILLADDWEGHPLRKDYKEPDYYHGLPVPKDKSYWD